MKRVKARQGFTLIEIVTVLAVMAVVSTLGTVVFFKMTSAWIEVRGRSALDEKADAVFATMQRDFDALLAQSVSGVPLRGLKNDVKSEEYFDRVLASDGVILPVRDAARSAQGHAESGLVMYQVDRANGAATLRRTTGAMESQQPGNNPTPIAEGVLRFQTEFAPRGGVEEWVRGWSAAALPAAVRVSLTLLDPDRPELQVSRVAVFPVHVH